MLADTLIAWQMWHGGICELGEEGEGGGANESAQRPSSVTRPATPKLHLKSDTTAVSLSTV